MKRAWEKNRPGRCIIYSLYLIWFSTLQHLVRLSLSINSIFVLSSHFPNSPHIYPFFKLSFLVNAVHLGLIVFKLFLLLWIIYNTRRRNWGFRFSLCGKCVGDEMVRIEYDLLYVPPFLFLRLSSLLGHPVFFTTVIISEERGYWCHNQQDIMDYSGETDAVQWSRLLPWWLQRYVRSVARSLWPI